MVWTLFFGAQPMSGNPQQGAHTGRKSANWEPPAAYRYAAAQPKFVIWRLSNDNPRPGVFTPVDRAAGQSAQLAVLEDDDAHRCAA